MGISVDDILAKFPTKRTIPCINGEPNYETINEMVQCLYGNAAAIPTTLGGGAHGHIGLLITPARYATLSPTATYAVPIDPGPNVTFAPTATAGAREIATHQY